MSKIKTRSAVKVLGTTYYKLIEAIRGGRLQAPVKDESGDYWWTDEDLERARQALATDRRKNRGQPPSSGEVIPS